MADRFAARDATGATVEILADEVTDASLGGLGLKQIVGLMDATPDSINKLIIDSAGRMKVDASGVAVPVTDGGGSLTVDDGGASVTVDGTVNIGAGPSAARTTDSIATALATDAIMNGLTVLTPKFTPINVSASGPTTIVALVAGKKIRVLGFFAMAAAAVSFSLRSHTTTATTTGVLPFSANGGIAVPFSPMGWFETVVGEALDVNIASAVAVGGMLAYVEV